MTPEETSTSSTKDPSGGKHTDALDLRTTPHEVSSEGAEGVAPVDTQQSEPLGEASEQAQLDWYKNVYQGDHVPQLTFRAVLMGGLLGSLMSISNLYTMIKVGWAFGVAITACVMSYVIWNALRFVFRNLTPMSILENNCMQSTASSAGYTTGVTIATAFGAYLLITGHQIPWQIVLPWTFITACLGVFLAIPMKSQMINHERLPFPSGMAAAETLRSLHSQSKEALQRAYALVTALFVGASVGVLRTAEFVPKVLRLPELLPFGLTIKGESFPGFGFEPSVLLMGAGMIVGLRVGFSMLLGSCLLYLIVGPWLVHTGDLESPAKLMKWSVWTGSALMVTSGLTAVGLQWKTIARAFGAFRRSKSSPALKQVENLEVPTAWFLLGAIPLTLAMTFIEYVAFSISPVLAVLSVLLSFFLSLVACRSTGETDVTPIGAMGKISQLTFAALAPANATTNLMTASVTANIAAGSADLLTDLKSGYLLGANPRKQFLAQFTGVFFGTITIVPAWYLMIPDAKTLDSYHPPSTYLYKAVAEALAHGISYVPLTARWGLLIGGVLGIVLTVLEVALPKYRKFMPSPMGLGLSWVMTFSNCLAFFLGGVIAAVWQRTHRKSSDSLTVPIASGAIAGESLVCAFIAMFNAAPAVLNAAKSFIH